MNEMICPRCHLMMGFVREYQHPLCPPCMVEEAMLKEIEPGWSVLDVGSGLARYHPALHERTDGNLVLLDAHLPNMVAHQPPVGVPLFIGEAGVILPALRDGIFNVVMAIDVIEHLEKPAALDLVREMKRLAENRVLLFTPDGFMPQEKDNYNLGGDHWQTHRSGWTADELRDLGFATTTWGTFHTPEIGALWGVHSIPRPIEPMM
jgi:ubiquinone/menaquinone biosynthesis C-methylase UbiE